MLTLSIAFVGWRNIEANKELEISKINANKEQQIFDKFISGGVFKCPSGIAPYAHINLNDNTFTCKNLAKACSHEDSKTPIGSQGTIDVECGNTTGTLHDTHVIQE